MTDTPHRQPAWERIAQCVADELAIRICHPEDHYGCRTTLGKCDPGTCGGQHADGGCCQSCELDDHCGCCDRFELPADIVLPLRPVNGWRRHVGVVVRHLPDCDPW